MFKMLLEDYNQCFENCNQEISIDNYNQYIDVFYENDYNQWNRIFLSTFCQYMVI